MASRLHKHFGSIAVIIIACFLLTSVGTTVGFTRPNGVKTSGKGYVSIESRVALAAGAKLPIDDIRLGSQISQLSNNNYEINISGETVHIGSATDEFTPEIRFNRFGGESYVDLNLVGGGSVGRFTTSTLSDNVVTAENQWFILTYAPVSVKPPFNDIGGVDMKMVLKKAPSINVITFTYNKHNAVAALQPALTSQEIAVNASRPDYAINSIVFYGNDSQKNNRYKTGKIGQLYRLQVTDSSPVPKTTWADWGFANNQAQITLTIDQAWLNNAVYPVTIQPVGDTFGYTSAGAASVFYFNSSYYRGSGTRYTGIAGTGVSMSVYGNNTISGTINVQLALYDNSTPSVFVSNTTGIAVNYTEQWWEGAFASSPTIQAIEYLEVFIANTDNQFVIHYDIIGSDDWINHGASYGVWDSPVTWGTSAGNYYKFSIYATVAVAPNISNTPASKDYGVVNTNTTYWATGSAPSFALNSTATASPSTSTSGNWTNPTNAYADGTSYANITSGLPSVAETYGGYGLSLSEDLINQVRVRTDAWSLGVNTNTTKSPTGSSGGWTNPTNAYADGTAYANITSGSPSASETYTTYGFSLGAATISQVRVRYDASSVGYTNTTFTKSPTASSGGWTNPTNAYADGTSYASITSGSPSVSETYSTYGFSLGSATISQVRVRYDAWTDGTAGSASSAIAYPSGDDADTASSWVSPASPVTRWDKVDEAAASDTDYYVMTTNAGGHTTFTFTNFTVPSGSVVTNLTILYRAGNVAANPANIRASLKIGTTYYDTTDAGVDPSDNTTNTTYYKSFTTNPATSAAWRVDEINGTNATVGLKAFGTASNDLNPDVRVTQCNATVYYSSATTYDEQIYVQASWDGGTTWSSNQTQTLSVSETTYWYDVTSATSWTPTTLNDANLQVRVWAVTVGTASGVNLDWIPVEVTYSTLSNEDIKVQTSWDNGSTWSSNVTTNLTASETTYWYDVTAATAWTATKLNDSNFQVRVWAITQGDVSDVRLDWVPVEVTYITLDNEDIKVQVTWDGGSSWSSNVTTNLTGTETTYWSDMTSVTTWTGTKLADANFFVRIWAMTNGDVGDVRLDWIPVEVIYDVPVKDANCTFTVTNNGTMAVNITIRGTNFVSASSNWTLGTPDATHARLTVYKSGDKEANGIVITTSDQSFITNLTSSGTTKWELKLETPTAFSDADEKSATITLTATAA